MEKINEILKSEKRSKEKISLLADEIKKDSEIISNIIKLFESADSGDQGHLMESIEYVSKDSPDLIIPYLDFIIKHLDNTQPRIKWECGRIIANLAPNYSNKMSLAIPGLLKNVKDEGTVVRWSSALALGEIAKYNLKKQKELIAVLQNIIDTEDNNGVKNLCIKALKKIPK